MRRGADSKEVGRGQGGTADQPSVHIRLREQFSGVGRLDAAAVKQSGQTGNHNIFLFQLATNEGVDLLSLLRAGGAASTDGPDRLVGDHGRIEAGNAVMGQYGLQLARDDRLGLAGFTLFQALAHAQDRREPSGTCRGNLRATSPSSSP